MPNNRYSERELSAICSNLAKACEKQHKVEEASLFKDLSSYFNQPTMDNQKLESFKLSDYIASDLETNYSAIETSATEVGDRGALRCMTWGKKVTAIHKSILARYDKQKENLLTNNNLYVCDACGFIAIAPQVIEICPICKAPSSRFVKI
jgi:rubrerythrin